MGSGAPSRLPKLRFGNGSGAARPWAQRRMRSGAPSRLPKLHFGKWLRRRQDQFGFFSWAFLRHDSLVEAQ